MSYTLTQYVDVALWLELDPRDGGPKVEPGTCSALNRAMSNYIIPLDVIFQFAFTGGRGAKPGQSVAAFTLGSTRFWAKSFIMAFIFAAFWPWNACSTLQADDQGRNFISWADYELPAYIAALVPALGLVHSLQNRVLEVRKVVIWSVYALQVWLHGKFFMNTWCLYCFALFPFMWVGNLERNLLEPLLKKKD